MNDKRTIQMVPTRQEEQNDDLGSGAGGGIFLRPRAQIALGLIIFAGYCLLYLAPLPFRPLYMPDETRYAEIPREILATGDWIVPRLNGLRYFEKPVLGYWITALSILSFGENRFAVRLPSALATGLSAMLLVWVLRRSGYTSSVLGGAVVFLTCLEVYALGVFNVLDALFSAFITASMVCFYLALLSSCPHTKIACLCASGVACGLGFLTKGLLALGIPAVAVCSFLLWQKRLKDLFTLPWIPLLVALAIVLPWAIMIHSREPDYWRHFIFVEHFQRFTSSDNKSLHPEPLGFLVPYLIGGAIPWTFTLPAAIKGLRETGFRDPFMRYALCWLAFPFLLLSMSQGKLGTYVLPCFAPLSLLFALGLTYRSKVSESRLFRAIALTCAVGAGLTAGVIAVVHFLNLAPGAIFSASETWKWIVGSAALAASSAIYVVSARAKSTMMSVYCFAAAPLTLMLSAHFIVPGQMLKSRAPEGFIERCAGSIDQGHQIYSTNYLAPAVCWVLKRTDIGILGRGGELQYGLNYPDAKNRQIQIPELAKRIDDGNRTTGIILVITERDYSRFRRYLPEASLMEKANGFVFLKYVSPLEHSRKP